MTGRFPVNVRSPKSTSATPSPSDPRRSQDAVVVGKVPGRRLEAGDGGLHPLDEAGVSPNDS